MRKTTFHRSDYGEVFDAGGADALNQLLVERYSPEVLSRELRRMRRSGFWRVKWDETGHGRVVGRGPGRKGSGRPVRPEPLE